jgi:hypothetical protein
MPNGAPTRQRAGPMVGMTIFNSWPNACEDPIVKGELGCQQAQARLVGPKDDRVRTALLTERETGWVEWGCFSSADSQELNDSP